MPTEILRKEAQRLIETGAQILDLPAERVIRARGRRGHRDGMDILCAVAARPRHAVLPGWGRQGRRPRR